MPNNQNHSGQAVTVMHITDAARIFHSFLLENHPDGLMENQMKQFYASEPQAGNRIRKRGLHQFIKEYSHLFSLIGEQRKIAPLIAGHPVYSIFILPILF